MIFLRRFWSYLLSLATLAALYLAAAAHNIMLVFLLIVLVAALSAVLVTTAPRIGEWITHVRNYPLLLKTAADLKIKHDRLAGKLREIEGEATHARSDGIMEGRRQIKGSLLALMARATLELKAVKPIDNNIALAASISDGEVPQTGARYKLEVPITGELRGVVEVRAFDEGRKLVWLECVDAVHPEFWRSLRARASVDSVPPGDMVLSPYMPSAGTQDREEW